MELEFPRKEFTEAQKSEHKIYQNPMSIIYA